MGLCWLLIVLFVVVLLWSSQEHMSNKDLIDTLKTFGVDDSTEYRKTPEESKQEIYGPGISEKEKPAPKPKSDEDSKKNVRGLYPHIYGPEYVGSPTKPYQYYNGPGKDLSEDELPKKRYEFNPDFQNAFPVSGPPQPCLTDFSKFQK